MTKPLRPPFRINRRSLIAGFGGALLVPSMAAAQPTSQASRLILRATSAARALRPGQPDSELWVLEPVGGAPPAFRRGDTVAVAFHNDLPVPAVLNWHGLDGTPSSEPLTARTAVAPGSKDEFNIPLRHAGTLLCDARLMGDGQSRATGALVLAVNEDTPGTVDGDEVLLIEDWRLGADGSAGAPGSLVEASAPVYTINGKLTQDLTLKANQRLRIRFINGCQRSVIAIKIENHDVRVMAIDGQPAEPFLTRNGQLVLAPGTRVDAFVDATAPTGSISRILLHDGTKPRPIGRLLTSADAPFRDAPLAPPPALPSNGLPEQIDLKGALRTELGLDRAAGEAGGWTPPSRFSAPAAPAFKAKRNRTVVIALSNRANLPVTFHLHGHHFRLLDRLDDGWKPFWLDTLLVDPQQTQRIAFKAEFAGVWLMEAMAADWAAPRLIRTYVIE